jgi:Family of unknown function (DUF6448)
VSIVRFVVIVIGPTAPVIGSGQLWRLPLADPMWRCCHEIRRFSTGLLLSVLVLTMILAWPARLLAHCDGLDGPVVKAARAALDRRDPAAVLIWVQASDEPEIRRAFEQTLAVRGLSPQAAELADRFFFETVVRVHRAGEGAPYTGLKPAGRDLGPAIPAADQALARGSAAELSKLLTDTVRERLQRHFDEVKAARAFNPAEVPAGREYVRAYVQFIHYVERLYGAATTEAHGHFDETSTPVHDSSPKRVPHK